ncbi:MAG: TetR/AcrR family transcriptional regulator [Dehalococcoidia bacterium]
MAPKVTEEHLETRRRQILEAAFTCFAREGFHHTTMQDICREAGLSPGAVYSYFKSKEEIIEASCEESQRGNMAFVESIIKGGDTLKVLSELLGFAFNVLNQDERQTGIRTNIQLYGEALRNPRIKGHLKRAGFDSWIDTLVKIIRPAQDKGEINPALDPEAVARVLVSIWHGMVIQKGLDPDVDIWRYVDVVKALYSGSFWTGDQLKGPTQLGDS